MKIYIAHNYSAGPALCASVVPYLQSLGHTITSRWIIEPETCTGNNMSSALMDLQDIDRADALLLFVDQVGSTPGRGKWFEFGYAHAKGKDIYLHGTETGCVFMNLPCVTRILNLSQLNMYNCRHA